MNSDSDTATSEVVDVAAVHGSRVGFIVGPTGVGKSVMALEIAEQLRGEIVNADARQLYRGMDIGTAKPTISQRRRVPHHLIDICSPDAPLDVAGFARQARAAIAEVAARGRPVLVVGGSGLYLRVIRGGICAAPPCSPEIRQELTDQARRFGAQQLHQRLSQIDAPAAAAINPNDLRRIVRALEVHQLSGAPLSEYQRRHRFAERRFTTLTIGLTLSRERLYAAIDRRFGLMLSAGLIDEVRRLLDAGYDPGAPPLCAIGYREIAAFLRGQLTLAEAAARARRESRRLAKRQLTWFRAEHEVVWLDAESGEAEALERFRNFFSAGAQL